MHSYASCWFSESHTVVTKICNGNHAVGYMSEMYDCPVFRFVYSLPFLTRTHHTLLEEP